MAAGGWCVCKRAGWGVGRRFELCDYWVFGQVIKIGELL